MLGHGFIVNAMSFRLLSAQLLNSGSRSNQQFHFLQLHIASELGVQIDFVQPSQDQTVNVRAAMHSITFLRRKMSRRLVQYCRILMVPSGVTLWMQNITGRRSIWEN
jgi:hypothetical protein